MGSSLPCRGVPSFRSGAREASGSETPRFDNVARCPRSAASAARNIAGFRSGLRDLGYLEGRNVTLALRYGDGAPIAMVARLRLPAMYGFREFCRRQRSDVLWVQPAGCVSANGQIGGQDSK